MVSESPAVIDRYASVRLVWPTVPAFYCNLSRVAKELPLQDTYAMN
jgi:hypothetical protein